MSPLSSPTHCYHGDGTDCAALETAEKKEQQNGALNKLAGATLHTPPVSNKYKKQHSWSLSKNATCPGTVTM